MTPPFWRSWWAFALYGLSAALLLGGALAVLLQRERISSLEALDKQKSEFFSDVAHEFRTPLTLITGPLEEAFLQTTENPKVRSALALALRNVRRLGQLVNQTLDFSKVSNKKMVPEALRG